LPEGADVTVDDQELFRLAHVMLTPTLGLALSF